MATGLRQRARWRGSDSWIRPPELADFLATVDVLRDLTPDERRRLATLGHERIIMIMAGHHFITYARQLAGELDQERQALLETRGRVPGA